MTAEPSTSATAPAMPKMTLCITFQGPLLFDFKSLTCNDPDATVDVYAPYCPYHEAGFFVSDFSYSETDLCRGANNGSCPSPGSCTLARRYIIKGCGIVPCPTAPQQITPVQLPSTPGICNDPILKPAPGDQAKVVHEKVLFHVTVPRPWLIYPLYCDAVNVVKGPSDTPSPNVEAYGTGLRFFYPWDTKSCINLYAPTKDPITQQPGYSKLDLTPPTAGTCSPLPDLGEIEVRYQGFGLEDRNDAHSDARSCFASVAVLAGLSEWWLNYEDGMSSPTNRGHFAKAVEGAEAHTGGDCGAPVVALGLPSIPQTLNRQAESASSVTS
jgi:hypothetical protein